MAQCPGRNLRGSASRQAASEDAIEPLFRDRQGGCLATHLALQVPGLNLAAPVERLLSHLIDCLDPNGYLPTDEDSPHARYPKPCIWSAAIEALQAFSPAGVGARDLRECLLLQAERDTSTPPLVKKIIGGHLDYSQKISWQSCFTPL